MEQTLEKNVIMEKVPSVFKEYRFVLLFLTTVVSSFSVSFFVVTTNWYIVNYLGLEAMLGLVMFASSVPRLAFMLIGGVIADRLSKPWIMFLSDFTKGILLLGVISLFLFDILSIPFLVILAFLFGVLDAFFYPASGSLLPSTVKQDQLTRANSAINISSQSSYILGPLLAGLMLASGGYVLIFGVTAAALLVAACIDVLLKNSFQEEKKEDGGAGEKGKNTVFQSIKDGFAYVKQSSFLLPLMVSAIMLNLFFTGPFMLGLPVFATSILAGDAVTYSSLSGGLAGGMVLGTLVIGMLNIRKKRGLVSMTGILLLALFFCMLSLTTVYWFSLALVILMGISSSLANVPLISVIQKHTKQEYLGRVMSLISFSAMGLVPVSYLITSLFLALEIPINIIMLVSSIFLLIVVSIMVVKAKALRTVD